MYKKIPPPPGHRFNSTPLVKNEEYIREPQK